MITALEELSLNAWPALQTLVYDGWILRFAEGYTKRANSVNPLYASSLPLDRKIPFCENMYKQAGLPTVFKLTAASQPPDLDAALADCGYRQDSATSVQLLDLAAGKWQVAPGTELHDTLSNEWLDAYVRMNGVSAAQPSSLGKILSQIIPAHCYVGLKVGAGLVACGLGVLQAESMGLFDIVTDPAVRRQGYGRQVVESLLAWGQHNGARRAYLQVMLNNSPALQLYEKIGFVEQYRYWYRIKP